MIRNLLFLLVLSQSYICIAQSLTGKGLLEKSIDYHDPKGNWKTFKGSFHVTMRTPDQKERISNIHLDLPREEFVLEVTKNKDNYAYQIERDSCNITLNGSSEFSSENADRLGLDCERGRMMKDYYTYLYGLPMKLKDPGTIIAPKIKKKSFKCKEYLVLEVNYAKYVGEDTWYFYFDPLTYAMEVYQFFHDEAKNDGEYILLEGMETINNIKMPKTRAWYYNKDDTYLGTDILSTN
jgi:hypothetical protein